MHLVSAMFTLFISLSLASLFPISLFFLFQFPIQIAQVTILVPLIGTVLIYTPNQAFVISLFYSHYSPTIFVYCKHSLEAPITLLVVQVQPPLPLSMCNIFSLFHYISHDKFSPIFILPCTYLSPLNGKTLGLFIPIPLACIKWSQPIYYLFWVNMLSQQSTYQKRSWQNTETSSSFPPPHQTTSSIIPLGMGPPSLQWLGISWCSCHYNVVFFLHTLPYFFPTWFLLLLFDFCPFYSSSRLRLPTCIHPLWRMMWACWACPILPCQVGPMGLSRSFPYCLSLIPVELAYWAFFLLPSLLSPFKAHSYFLKRVISP